MLSRREVARKLGVSTTHVIKLEGIALHPMRDARGHVQYDEDEVYRLARTWQKPTGARYAPSQLEQLADSVLRRDVAQCIERGYSLTQTINALSTRDSEEIERVYDELSATTEERHQRELDRIRENGRAKELLTERRERLRVEFDRMLSKAK